MEMNAAFKKAARLALPVWLVRLLDPVAERIRSAVLELAGELPGGSLILDAGCGENRFKRAMTGHRVIGYDSGVGDRRWDYGALDVMGDLESLAVRTSSMDAAMLIVVLEHVRRPSAVLAEIARVLKPGGCLLLVVPLLWEEHQVPNDYFRFTRYGVAMLLEEAGLKPLRLEPLGGFFALSARRCINMLSFFQGSWRWPLFVLLLPFLGFIFPLALRFLDCLDREKRFTLGYEAWACRPREGTIVRPEGKNFPTRVAGTAPPTPH